MVLKFGNTTKRHTIVLFRFIEGISIILKLRQVKLLQIEGSFVRTPMNNSAEIQGFLFLNVKILQIEAAWFETIFLFWILNSINSNYKWAANFSKMPDEFEIRFWFSKKSVYFRWFAFENTNLVDAKFHIFQNFRNLWFWNFCFRWFDIIEKMSDFDGWPSVG